MIADGDSNLYKFLRDNIDWGMTKRECINHLLKNYKGKLMELAKESTYTLILNELVIDKICAYTRKIINRFGKDQDDRDENLMKLLIMNVPKHIFGFHDSCTNDFCDKDKDNKQADVRLNKSMIELLQSKSKSIRDKIKRVFENTTTNLAECYHSIRTSLDAGKCRNYVMRGSFELRSHCAALRFNEGPNWFLDFWSSIKENDPIMKQYLNYVNNEFIRRKEQKKSMLAVKKKVKTKNSAKWKTEKVYGPDGNKQDEDIDFKDLYQRCITFMKEQRVEKNEISEISVLTQSQSSDDQWFNLRKSRLTASNFGKIAKQLKDTNPVGLVTRILYPPGKPSEEMLYGIENEDIARAKFTEATGIKVELTGLHIDADNGWLACSPDGLISDELGLGVLEIKCVASKEYRHAKIVDIIGKMKSFCLQKNNNNEIFLKPNHIYYYQVQGQMHITQRVYCEFVVYTTADIFHQRIPYDKKFWDEKIFPKLYRFYIRAYVPEILLKNHLSKKALIVIPNQFLT